jgi:GDP-L-fucose synthase
MMQHSSRIYVAGHRGLAGSAIVRALHRQGFTRLVTRTRSELDLIDQAAVRDFFEQERPEFVFLAAARVGGILANNSFPADFIYHNLAIQTNVIHECRRAGVERLIFLGSSCIYPRDCPQPIREDSLLTGPLEATNRPYAIAKIAGIELCWSYNRQYSTHYLAAMPTNLFGPGDNYDLKTSHVLPALLRKFHDAKQSRAPSVEIWGTGTPLREFMFVDDMADAMLYLMNNVGTGKEISIRELAETIAKLVGYRGKLVFDGTKPDGTPRKMMDVSRLASLGWQAPTNLLDGLRVTYENFLQHPPSEKPH